MAICASGENWLQEATGIRRGRVYQAAKNNYKLTIRLAQVVWIASES